MTILPQPILSTEPPIVLGCSPFVASKQFENRCYEYETRFQGHPEEIMKIWTAFAEAGGKAIHLVDDEAIWSAFEKWRVNWSNINVWLTIASSNVSFWCERLASRGGGRVFRHARAVDAGEDLSSFIDIAHSYGLKPGAVTHQPGNFTKSFGDESSNYKHCIPLLVPFNALGLYMDIALDILHNRLKSRGGEVFAMMPLGAGRIPFADGIAFTALHFGSQIVGTGNPQHARTIAEIAPLAIALSEAVTFCRRNNSSVDVGESTDEVVFLNNHKCLRLRDAAARLWLKLSEPLTLIDLVEWAEKESGRDGSELLPSITGCLLTLMWWELIDTEPRKL